MTPYTFFRHYACWLHRCCYSQYRVIGRENIPTDGAIILAPNHTNALQDAISAADAVQKDVVFVGRAAMFKKPALAAICRFFKIMPIGRMRDGIDEVKKNDEVFNRAVEVMQQGTPFAIFAEGTMRSMHSLLPLVKGIFRIALQAHEAGEGGKVYILPMGFDYDDFYHFGDRLTIEIGKPIEVGEFVANHPDLDRPHLINALQAELQERMVKLFRYLPDDVRYPALHKKYFGSRKANNPLLRIIAAVLGLPLFILSAIVCWPCGLMELYIHYGIRDHGFDSTFRFLPPVFLGLLSMGTILPFWFFCVYYLANLRLLMGIQPKWHELVP